MNIFKRFFNSKKTNAPKNSAGNSLDILLASLTEEIDKIVNEIDLLKCQYNTSELPLVINNFLFFKVSFRDIVNLTKQLSEVKEDQQKNLLNRTLSLHLYEFLDDMKDLLGKKFKKDLEELPNNEFLIRELYRLKEYHKAIKTLIFKDLGDIRHNTIAHKTQDSMMLNEMIKNIDPKEVNTNCILVWLLFTLLINFETSIVESIKYHLGRKTNNEQESEESFKRELGIDAEMKKNIMIIKGVSPDFAKLICTYSDEQIRKLQTTVNLLAKELEK